MTIPYIILRAEISQYLAVNALKQGGLFGGGTPRNLPSLIYQVRKAVSRMYDLDPTDANLVKNANYLYTICYTFGMQASYLINSGGVIPSGGSTIMYGRPINDTYIAVVDGETVIDLSLPSGAIVWQVMKSILTLSPSEYSYVSPNLNLLNGISLSAEEQLSYSYVVPIT